MSTGPHMLRRTFLKSALCGIAAVLPVLNRAPELEERKNASIEVDMDELCAIMYYEGNTSCLSGHLKTSAPTRLSGI